jgi:hypothetical protein|tara:strand:- start:9349 stop:9804 length:456 start_codon:yes stop_codon:yes gene_type:complete
MPDPEEIEIEMPKGFAPVAEYMGVAILEGQGEEKTVWEGTEYGTDGRCYILLKSDDPTQREVMIVPSAPEQGFSAEHCAKAIIEGSEQEWRDKALTFLEVLETMGEGVEDYIKQHKGFMAAGGRFDWDGKVQAFVRVEPKMYGRGKSDHRL